MKALFTLCRREFWEYKSTFLYIPIIIGALLNFVVLCTIIFVAASANASTQGLPQGVISNLTAHGIAILLYGTSFPFILVLWVIALYYFISCLYDDRKNGSVLFWASMPISQTQIIAAKAITGLLLAPLITWLCVIGTNLVFLMLLSVAVSLFHLGSVAALWQPLGSLYSWGVLLISLLKQAMWILPIAGWFMLCSAYSKKAPFLRATVPIIFIIIMELFFTQHHYFTNFVRSHFVNVLNVWNEMQFTLYGLLKGNSTPLLFTVHHPQYATDLSTANLMVGLCVGLLLMISAGLLRYQCHDFSK